MKSVTPDTSTAPEPTTVHSNTHFLGARIRTLRKKHGLTLVELARQSGLTAGYISQLERNLCCPSIHALVNISSSLGVTIQWFLVSATNQTDPSDSGYVIRKHDRLRVPYEEGIVDELLSPQPIRQLELLHSRFPPGTYAQQHYRHSGEEAGYVLSGVFELWVGERHFLLQEGDSFSFPSQEPHRYGNPSEQDTRVLWVTSTHFRHASRSASSTQHPRQYRVKPGGILKADDACIE